MNFQTDSIVYLTKKKRKNQKTAFLVKQIKNLKNTKHKGSLRNNNIIKRSDPMLKRRKTRRKHLNNNH